MEVFISLRWGEQILSCVHQVILKYLANYSLSIVVTINLDKMNT